MMFLSQDRKTVLIVSEDKIMDTLKWLQGEY